MRIPSDIKNLAKVYVKNLQKPESIDNEEHKIFCAMKYKGFIIGNLWEDAGLRLCNNQIRVLEVIAEAENSLKVNVIMYSYFYHSIRKMYNELIKAKVKQ